MRRPSVTAGARFTVRFANPAPPSAIVDRTPPPPAKEIPVPTAPKPRSITPSVARKLAVRAQSSDEAVAVGNRSGLIEWANASWNRITGYAVDQVVGKPVVQLLDEVGIDPTVVEFIHLNFLACKRSVVELPIEAPDGRSLWIHLEVDPVRDEFDDVSDFVAVATNITDLRVAEIALDRHLEREPIHEVEIGEVGTLAEIAGATEVGEAQPRHGDRSAAARDALLLDAIGMGRELLHLLDPDLLDPDLEDKGDTSTRSNDPPINPAAERLRSCVEHFMERVDRADVNPCPAEIAEELENRLAPVCEDLRQSIAIDADLSAPLPLAHCDVALVCDATIEWVEAAARHHFSRWGTVSLTTGVTRPGHPLASSVYHTSYAATLDHDLERVYIEVHDDGHAVGREEMACLEADPLAPPPAGRAFNLLRTRALIEAGGGEFHIHSSVGCGTRILILLPVSR